MATISNPFVMEVPRKLTDEELVNAIRQDIIGELEAIHEYDAHEPPRAALRNGYRVKSTNAKSGAK